MALKLSAERHPGVTARVTRRLQGAATVSRRSERTARGLTAQRCDFRLSSHPIHRAQSTFAWRTSVRRRFTMTRAPRHTLAAALIVLALVGCRDASAPNDAARSRPAEPMMSDATDASLVLH